MAYVGCPINATSKVKESTIERWAKEVSNLSHQFGEIILTWVVKTLVLSIVVLSIIGCKKGVELKMTSIPRIPLLVDSSIAKLSFSKHLVSNYNLVYIGKNDHSVMINYDLSDFKPLAFPTDSVPAIPLDSLKDHPLFPYHFNWLEHDGFHFPDSSELTITIDTAQSIRKRDESRSYRYYRAYAVILENNGEDTVAIGYYQSSLRLRLIAEAKDSLGTWKPIEERVMYGCGNGLDMIALPPNEIAVSSIFRFSGPFHTKLRLRMDETYSNEISATINYSQFDESDYY